MERVRELSEAERQELERLSRARTEAAQLVRRARMVLGVSQGQRVSQVAHAQAVSETAVRTWVQRFNAEGIAGLVDRPRAGRPATYTPEAVATVLAVAGTKPDALGLPFGSWTLDRLTAYLNEERGIGMQRSRLEEVLKAEGLDWRQEETWFSRRTDPEFAEKRGRSSGFAASRRRTA